MSKSELSSVLSIALLMAFRMLGMFMVLPIFATAATHLQGSTPALIGLTLGIYGLTQAMLQIPFGALSDKIGRKPIIAIGLVLLIIGSLIAAQAHSIYGVLLGRALQGAGAIGSTCLALLADLTRDENRSKAMAMVGMMIGLSFSVAIVLGPMINHYFQLNGIFWTTAILGVLALCILLPSIAKPPRLTLAKHSENRLNRYRSVFSNTQLLRLNLGIFSQHAMLTSLFVILPLLLTHSLGLTNHQQTLTYLLILSGAFIASIPLIIIAEAWRKMKPVFLLAISTLTISSLLLISYHQARWDVFLLLFLFFGAFSLLEATLPSLVSKLAAIRYKGTAMGVYSTAQFLGIFIGGSLSGWLYGHYSITGVLLFMSGLGLLWLLWASTMAQPPYLSTIIFSAPNNTEQAEQLITQFQQTAGIQEAAFSDEEQLIYLKVDKKIINPNELRNQVEACNLA